MDAEMQVHAPARQGALSPLGNISPGLFSHSWLISPEEFHPLQEKPHDVDRQEKDSFVRPD